VGRAEQRFLPSEFWHGTFGVSAELVQYFGPVPASTYAHVWVRAVPGKLAPEEAALSLGGGMEQGSGSLNEQWICLESLALQSDASSRSDITVSWRNLTGLACIAVDDAVVYAIPPGGIPDVCKCPL
jgi:hypothetical protein